MLGAWGWGKSWENGIGDVCCKGAWTSHERVVKQRVAVGGYKLGSYGNRVETVARDIVHRNVLPAIGLVHLPFFAARISAYNAGLMPFFWHFLISAGVKSLMSKLLALHSLLDLEGRLSAL